MSELKKSTDIEDLSRIENLKELVSAAVEFEQSSEETKLADFLEKVNLVSDIDNFDESADSVVLMTLHSAKGLEFPVVFMAGMEEGLFPHRRSMNDPEELEEERRLCYVGMTRAREVLYLTYAQQRMLMGNIERSERSRFVREIPKDLIAQKPVSVGGSGLWQSARRSLPGDGRLPPARWAADDHREAREQRGR
jgi:DNA helicase-2/ATP-dependent DNA helicase PcrA